MKFDIWAEDIPGLLSWSGEIEAKEMKEAQAKFLERETDIMIREDDIFVITPRLSVGGSGSRQGLRFKATLTIPKLIAEVVK